jgi:heat shock protein HslJ
MKTAIIILMNMFILLSCEKTEKQNEDIKSWDWKLISLKVNDVVYTPEKRDNFKTDAYFLYLLSDTSFRLVSSVNTFNGSYVLFGNNNITFKILTGTRIGQSDSTIRKFDDNFISTIDSVLTYKLSDSLLILEKSNNKVVNFVKVNKN